MCSAFFSVRVKSLFLKETVKNAGETPTVRKSKSQAAGRRPFVSQDKPAVRKATSKAPKTAPRKSWRAGWLQDFELAFAIGR